MNQLIDKLPPYLDNIVYSYIIPKNLLDFKNIIFKNKYITENGPIYKSGYNLKYEVAYDSNDKVIRNKKGIILSRIPKKNGKHRYYATYEVYTLFCYNCNSKYINDECPCDCYNQDDWYEYSSKFIGKDLSKALVHLFK